MIQDYLNRKEVLFPIQHDCQEMSNSTSLLIYMQSEYLQFLLHALIVMQKPLMLLEPIVYVNGRPHFQ